jgi:hypothetical protein
MTSTRRSRKPSRLLRRHATVEMQHTAPLRKFQCAWLIFCVTAASRMGAGKCRVHAHQPCSMHVRSLAACSPWWGPVAQTCAMGPRQVD